MRRTPTASTIAISSPPLFWSMSAANRRCSTSGWPGSTWRRRRRRRRRRTAAFARDLRSFLRGEPVEAQPFTWLVRVHKVLARRHQDTVMHDWSTVLVLEGATILGGCSLIHLLWQELPWTAGKWWPIFVTKM